MQSILSSGFVKGMVKATSDMWLKGWDERNGGNVSLRLREEEVKPFAADFCLQPRCIELTQPAPALANDWFLVTGSGKFMRNVQLDPRIVWHCCRSMTKGSLIKFTGACRMAVCRPLNWRHTFSLIRCVKRSARVQTG